MPKLASCTKLSEGTAADFKICQDEFAKEANPEALTERLIKMLENMKGAHLGMTVDLYEHSLQSATRAMEDGADEETIVCALLHDIGELLVPICHGEVAASLLRPYISAKNYWVLQHHEIFQAFYYGNAMGVDKDVRERFRGHQFFKDCEKFCEQYDEPSFDPKYKSKPLSTFKPMILNVLKRTPYAQAGLTDDPVSACKASLNNYDFAVWGK